MTDIKATISSDKSSVDELEKCEAEIANLVEEIENSHVKASHIEDGNNKPVNGSTKPSYVVARYSKPTNESSSKTESASPLQRLSRRESSLENLADPDENDYIADNFTTNTNTNTTCDNVDNDTTISKPTNDITAISCNVESDEALTKVIRVNKIRRSQSSRLRRTISSLFSCCRNSYGDSYSDPNDSRTKLSMQQSQQRPCLNCVKLRRLFVNVDGTNRPSCNDRTKQQRMIPSGQSGGGYYSSNTVQSTNTYCSRDGDNNDGKYYQKTGDMLQSENGGPNVAKPILLGPIKSGDSGKKCLIIDLDETLVHSSFKMVDKADFKVGVEIEGTIHTVYVLKRPHVDVFLQKMGRLFECVLFTASLAKYADPVADFLDKWSVFRWRLFREACVFHRGNYVKDLDMVGRPISQIAILDNSPASYLFHPSHAIQITSWFDDPRDTALLDLLPYLERLADTDVESDSNTVPHFLASNPPPAKATVPVTVMLSQPPNLTQMSKSTSPQSQQPLPPTSPITFIQPSTTTADIDTNSTENQIISSTNPNSFPAVIVSDVILMRKSLLTPIYSPLTTSYSQKSYSLSHLHNESKSSLTRSNSESVLWAFRQKQKELSLPCTINSLNLLKQIVSSRQDKSNLRSHSVFFHDDKVGNAQKESTHSGSYPNIPSIFSLTKLLPIPSKLDQTSNDSNMRLQPNNNNSTSIQQTQYLQQPRSVSLCLLHSMEDIPSETSNNQSNNLNLPRNSLNNQKLYSPLASSAKASLFMTKYE